MKTVSNVYLIGFAVTVSVVILGAAAAASSNIRSKPRATRGFKNAALSTARGFGKRDGYYPPVESSSSSLSSWSDDVDETKKGPGYGSLDAEYREPQESDSFPVEWFVEEIAGNPRLARLIVKKFIDQNRDGEVTPDELLRNGGGY